MKRRYYYIISIILIVIVLVSLVVYFDYSSASKTPASTPPLLYTPSISPQIINASQGSTQQVNLTLTSLCSTKIAIPLENLTINGYTIGISYNVNASSPWGTSVQERVFNYSFSLNQLILQPFKSNSTMITIYLTDSFLQQPTTLGSYSLDINFGKVVFLSLPEKYDISYSGDFPFVMIVTPPSANLKTALNVTDKQAYTTDVIGVVDSNYPFHNMYISGSVTNIGKAIAFNAGLHVVAYDNSALEVDMTVPLGDGLAFGTDSATNAFLANNLTYGISSLKLSSLDNGKTMTINISIYHEGNVSNWTITPVWTNSP